MALLAGALALLVSGTCDAMAYFVRVVLLLIGALLWGRAAQALVPVGEGSWRGAGSAQSCTGSLDPALAACILGKVNSRPASDFDQCTFVNVSSNSAGAQCRFIPNNIFLANGSAEKVPGSCPANSTPVTGGCQCASGFDESAGQCVPKGSELQQFCSDNAARMNTFKQSGTVGLNSPIPSGSCYKPYPPFEGVDANKGCAMTLGDGAAVGVPSEGLKHWSASGRMTGETCDDDAATDASPKAADDPCPNGFPGTVNGVTKCVAAEPDKGIEGVKSTSQTSSDGTKVDTKETTKCDGSICTTTTNTTTTSSSGTVTNSTSSRTESIDDKCSKDPKNPVCKKTQGGAGSATSEMTCDINPSAQGCGGEGAAIGDLYAKKDKTVAQVLTKAKNDLQSSPLGSSVTNFFNVGGGGTCPNVTAAIPFINKTITIDTFCTSMAAQMFVVIKAVLLMLATWMAFRIAIDN